MTSEFVTLVDQEGPGDQRIDKETINQLPLSAYKGEIVLVSDGSGLHKAVAELRKESVLGFDTESRPSFRKGDNFGVSLLQLAGANRVFLFQLAKISDPGPLFSILRNGKILKVGVALHDDIRKLQDIRKFKPGGFVEIADCTQKAGIVNTGLRSLVAYFLGFRISKRAQVSNWARKNLTDVQIQYAATDAWVSRELYLCCKRRGLL